MRNPTVIVKAVMFDNDLLFYNSERFKVIPRTMSFSLTCFTEWERKGRHYRQCARDCTQPEPCPWDSVASMNVKSIAVVDFLVETSGNGICKVGAVILLKPLFPTHHGATIQDLAQSLLPPVRPPCHLPAVGSHSPGLKVHTTSHALCPLLSPQGWFMHLISIQAPKSEGPEFTDFHLPLKMLP